MFFQIKFFLSFIIILFSINYLHFNFGYVTVVFYDTILVVFASVLCTNLVFWKILRKRSLDYSFLITLCSLLLGYAYAISVPTVIDRSLSIYILESIKRNQASITLDGLDRLIRENYISDHKLAQIRLTEQVESGTLSVDDYGCINLTDKGRFVVLMTTLYRKEFLPNSRLIGDSYSSALKDVHSSDLDKIESCIP